MTPYELCLFAEVFQEKYLAKQEEQLTLVWLGEYYHRTKKLPSIKSELTKLSEKEKPKMSDNDMFLMVERLNKQLKGKSIEPKR